MKRNPGLILMTILLAGVLILAGCAKKQVSSSSDTAPATGLITLKVGAAVTPHAEILNFIKPDLKKEGIDLQVITIDNEAQLNPSLQDKQIDANYFQHVPYLDSVSKEKGYQFTAIAKVHIEPMGFYSRKIKAKDELKPGAKIAIPDNPSNEYRALALLQNNGLIKLKEGLSNYSATPRDIIDNPKNLVFSEVEAQQLPRILPDVDGAVINTNWVLEAKIDPNSALFREDANSPYANVLVVRKGDESRPEIKKLVEYLTSDKVKQFIKDKYGVAVVPAF
ncbi:MAG TPA: MetQ/NlpA family ABC transporter substrate-binding protein [Syntrophomonadaceae bacterium]|nr:MetQ/NlpA family ABC transporter substrate-binding protein [Syntrophomonadaceae bacterium]